MDIDNVLKNIRLIAIDLSNTLTEGKSISQSNITAIKNAHNKRYIVVLVTCKSLWEIQHFDLSGVSYFICANGSSVFRLSDKSYQHISPITKTEYTSIFKTIKDYDVMHISHTRDTEIVDKQIYKYADILKVRLYCNNHEETMVIMRKLTLLDLNCTPFCKIGLDITSSGVDKWSGIKYLCQILDIQPKEVATIGNSINDMSMFIHSGLSAVVENASSRAKEYVSVITPTISHNGVAHFINMILDRS